MVGMSGTPAVIMCIFECASLVFCFVLWGVKFIHIFLLLSGHIFLTDKVFCANYIKD